MTSGRADLREKQARRSDQAGRGDVPRVPRELADYKRASVRAPLVSMPMTSAHPCGGRWSQVGRAVASDRRRGPS